jgi:hypothetical protein
MDVLLLFFTGTLLFQGAIMRKQPSASKFGQDSIEEDRI